MYTPDKFDVKIYTGSGVKYTWTYDNYHGGSFEDASLRELNAPDAKYDTCPSCGTMFDGGVVEDGIFRCPKCGHRTRNSKVVSSIFTCIDNARAAVMQLGTACKPVNIAVAA